MGEPQPLNKYIAFFDGRQKQIDAPSAFSAQQQAIAAFKPTKSKRHMVHVKLAELDGGVQVLHSTAGL